MKFTYYGHACFGLEIGGKHILVDPFISHNPLAKDINIESIPADYIFVTHGHSDHIADCVAIAERTNAVVVSNWEVIAWLQKEGLKNVHPMNIGGSWTFDFGMVKCVNAVHSSSMPDDTYGGNPMGFIFFSQEGHVYYSGDTALTMDLQLIPHWAELKAAILPIGDNFTMDYQDACIASDLIKCNNIIGVHYDTFGFIKIDKTAAQTHFTNNGKTLTLPEIGGSLDL